MINLRDSSKSLTRASIKLFKSLINFIAVVRIAKTVETPLRGLFAPFISLYLARLIEERRQKGGKIKKLYVRVAGSVTYHLIYMGVSLALASAILIGTHISAAISALIAVLT